MRTAACIAALVLGACSDDPSVRIIAPLPDTSVVASVELRCQGSGLTGLQTRIYLDLDLYAGDLIENSLPSKCDDSCNFVIAFAGAQITNGPHTLGVYLFDGEQQITSDAIKLVFAR